MIPGPEDEVGSADENPSPYREAPKGGRLRRWLLAFAVLGLIGLGALGGLYQYYVVAHPGDHIDLAYIRGRIARESPVYYRDGETKIGVFFDEEHRQYVTFAQLPEDYINAIVAAEDKRFWSHPGFDVWGFTRAMLGNLKSRRLIGGGSTITSQTAKNLYDRQGRSLGPKLLEVLNAFRLEARYTKEQILEFYVNQFHVYGNGRGLGVAARYFFDKEVEELNTLECAFLAGVVKGPHNYNPFVGDTQAQRDKALARADARVDYVLTRMAKEGYLSPGEAETLKAEAIPFNRGQFRYEQNVILDHVFKLLREEPFASLLIDAGVIQLDENGVEKSGPETAGLEIVTTIDAHHQTSAEYGLRHALTEVGGMFEGVDVTAFVHEGSGPPKPVRTEELAPYQFLKGVLMEAVEGEEDILVDLGGVVGVLDSAAINRVATILAKAKAGNKWTKASKSDKAALREALLPGLGVDVSLRPEVDDKGRPLLDLEMEPELEGAILTLDQGEITAMVGGVDNRNFNRATMARRQFGSTFKPLIYAAAMTLGWSPVDPIDNRRQGFAFQNQPFYWPRAAHEPPAEFMSMAKAGASSENLAAVSLLYHITDPLKVEAKIDLAKRVGMAPNPQEPSKDFGIRMRDVWGLGPTDESMKEGLYKEALRSIWPDLVFEGLVPGEGWALRHLPYGRGFPEELARLPKSGVSSKERAIRADYLSKTFLALEVSAVRGQDKAKAAMKEGGSTKGFYRWINEGREWLVFSEGAPKAGWVPIKSGVEMRDSLRRGPRLLGSNVTTAVDDSAWEDPFKGGEGSAERDGISGKEGAESLKSKRPRILGQGILQQLGINIPSSLPAPVAALSDRLLIEGIASPAALERLRASIDEGLEASKEWDRFDMRRLVRDRDFCLLLGMNYVIQLAKEAGIHSELKPVLSLPLGSSDTQLLEMALLYQFFLQGRVYTFGETEEPRQAAIIKEIRTVDGDVIYRGTSGWRQLVDPWVAASVGRILREAVADGTGKRGNEYIPLTSPDKARQAEIAPFAAYIPLMGKTGTTNDYINAAFVGFLPTLPGGEEGTVAGFPYGSGLTVAAYVGYDDNHAMRRKSIRLDGASGALPAWLETTLAISRGMDISRRLDLAELAFTQKPTSYGNIIMPILWPTEMEVQTIDPVSGVWLDPELLEDPGKGEPYEVFVDPLTQEIRARYQPFHPGQ